MTIRQLSLTDFRNLQSVTLDFNPCFNILSGPNGSGKTSLLETINILCQGQSFKTSYLDECIKHDRQGFLLFAKFDSYKAGISRSNQKTCIHLNGQAINKLSLLAEKTPIRAINTSCFELVTGSPSKKREYIDWCLFHVEHDFKMKWATYSHALKQKNSLLKKKNDLKQLDYWDQYLSQNNLTIYRYRKSYIKKISHILKNEVFELIDDLDINLEYEPGWNTEESLDLVFKRNRAKELRYGFTQYGIHRDNIKIISNKLLVQKVLSRGQLKRISIALIVAQIILVKRIEKKQVILLIDDIYAELDRNSVKLVLELLKNLNVQIFLTTISFEKHLHNAFQEYKMFHVEHGIIKAVKNT